MNNTTKLLFLLACGMVGQAFTQEQNHKVAPLAAIAIVSALKDASEIKDLIITAYNSLPPAEQQQIVNTLVSLLLSSLQTPQTANTQTTSTQPNTQTTSSTPTATTQQ
jgi:hypothetical protein